MRVEMRGAPDGLGDLAARTGTVTQAGEKFSLRGRDDKWGRALARTRSRLKHRHNGAPDAEPTHRWKGNDGAHQCVGCINLQAAEPGWNVGSRLEPPEQRMWIIE